GRPKEIYSPPTTGGRQVPRDIVISKWGRGERSAQFITSPMIFVAKESASRGVKLERGREDVAPARDNRRDRPYEPVEQARAAPTFVPTLPLGRVREDSLIDGSRRRRTKDRVRKAWYARHRQRRFARRLGFPAAEVPRVRSCPGNSAGP